MPDVIARGGRIAPLGLPNLARLEEILKVDLLPESQARRPVRNLTPRRDGEELRMSNKKIIALRPDRLKVQWTHKRLACTQAFSEVFNLVGGI